MCNSVLSSVAADGQAPLGARTSAASVNINFVSHIHVYIESIYMSPALEELQ